MTMPAPEITETTVRESGAHGEVQFPLIVLSGADPGPRVAILAGMHGAEYAGIAAAYELVSELRLLPLRGTVKLIPILNLPAFFRRSEQLSPIDEHELHYLWPQESESSHSHHLMDLVFRTVADADVVVDLHGGGFTQSLVPHVNVPSIEDADDLWERCVRLAQCFDVPFICQRSVRETPLALPTALLERGIPNVWTEIGDRGSTDRSYVQQQRDGLLNLLRYVGCLPGQSRLHDSPLVGPRHWSLIADVDGLWWPNVEAGQRVEKNQSLGRIVDVFGHVKKTYAAPADALIKYVCISPAIDASRQPHGYRWHQGLVQMVEV